jgi:hypothetical protein
MPRTHPTWQESRESVTGDIDGAVMEAVAIAVIKTARGISKTQRHQLISELRQRLGEN